MAHAPPSTAIATRRTIFIQEIGSQGKRPRIALVTSLGSGEFNGVFVLARLADYLRGVVDGAYPGQRLCGRVLIILTSPSDDAMNRGTPVLAASAKKGPITKKSRQLRNDRQSVEEIIETTRTAYYRVEIGASGKRLEELPQVCLHECSDDERASAFLFGLPAIIEHPMQALAADALATAWQSLGGENFVIRAGQASKLQPQHCEKLFRALVSFLDRTGVLEGIDLCEEEDDIHHFGVHQTLPVLTNTTGFFVSRLEVGRWVRAGESVGMVYDRFLGVLTADIKAPTNGLVSALRRHPLLVKGDLVAQIQTHDPILIGLTEP
jgi:predicted deacylase